MFSNFLNDCFFRALPLHGHLQPKIVTPDDLSWKILKQIYAELLFHMLCSFSLLFCEQMEIFAAGAAAAPGLQFIRSSC